MRKQVKAPKAAAKAAIMRAVFLIKTKKTLIKFCRIKKLQYLCNRLRQVRAHSSAGLEHLPYKQRVGGSNPSTPTTKSPATFFVAGLFVSRRVDKIQTYEEICFVNGQYNINVSSV